MLDNVNIRIDEEYLDYFDEEKNVWCYTAFWEDALGINTDYIQETPYERGAIIAEISKDGEDLKWIDNFEEAICANEENSWVLENIEIAQREIKEEYLFGTFK